MSELSRNTNKRPSTADASIGLRKPLTTESGVKRPSTADAGLEKPMTAGSGIKKLPLTGVLPVLDATTDIGFAR
jgi:hypothetical protein